jgi:hypothetical protein
MRNLSGRIKRLEQGVSGCPGDWGPIPMYRCYEWAADRVPDPDPVCKLCRREHDPRGSSEDRPHIRQILIIVPEDHEDDEIGLEGWVDEMELWERRRRKQ